MNTQNKDADASKTIKLRSYAIAICAKFENLLDEHGIKVPDEDRTGDESEACLYGMTYAVMEDAITDILSLLAEEIKKNPTAEINDIDMWDSKAERSHA